MGALGGMKIAVIKDGKAIQGDSVAYIILMVFDIKFTKGRKLRAKIDGGVFVDYITYSDTLTQGQMMSHAIQFLFERLPDYGYEVYTKQ